MEIDDLLVVLRRGPLEERRRAEPYGFPDLAGYALQLRILHRMDQWEVDIGRAVFEEQVETLLNPITKNMFVQQEVGA